MAVTTPQLLFDGSLPRPATSLSATWAGRSLSGLATLFLLADSIAKLLEVPAVIEGSAQLGYPAHTVFGLGLVLLLSVVVYLIPRTAVLGAILLTGYLGGAVATHVRVGNPLLTHTLFPVYLGVTIWAGLVLRDQRLRAILAGRQR
jgi:hypothetical protein